MFLCYQIKIQCSIKQYWKVINKNEPNATRAHFYCRFAYGDQTMQTVFNKEKYKKEFVFL